MAIAMTETMFDPQSTLGMVELAFVRGADPAVAATAREVGPVLLELAAHLQTNHLQCCETRRLLDKIAWHIASVFWVPGMTERLGDYGHREPDSELFVWDKHPWDRGFERQ